MKLFNSVSLISLFFVLCSSCGSGEGEQPASAEDTGQSVFILSAEQFQMGEMALGSLQEMDMPLVVTATGMIDVPPSNRALVSAYQAGYIKNTPLLVGDQVRQGQVVVTMEHPEFVRLQQQYLEISGQLTYLKAEYERQQALLEAQVTSRKNFLKAESDYNTAMATYMGLGKTLELLNIDPAQVQRGELASVVPVLAPIGGRVTRVNVSKGMFVAPSDPILEIIDRDHIHLELAVFEKDILKVKEGQQIRFTIPEAEPAWFDASVYLVGTSLETSSRTVKVHAHLEGDRPSGLAIGMFVEAEIRVAGTAESALPEEAVIRREDGAYAFLLKGQENDQYQFELVRVEPGVTSGGFTAIGNPEVFPEEARFLTKGAYSLPGEE